MEKLGNACGYRDVDLLRARRDLTQRIYGNCYTPDTHTRVQTLSSLVDMR
jgi:hypothetical protein